MMNMPRLRLNTSFLSYARILQGQVGLTKKATAQELRSRLIRDFGTENTLELNQGRIGMYLCIKALVEEGRDEIILSPYTLYEVVNMVIYAGGKPVFSDTDPNSPFVSKQTIEALISPRTAAVVLTHYHQTNPQLIEIRQLCDAHGIKLVEDCAIAYGTKFQGKMVGSHGHVGIFSYGLFKNVAAYYGGALVAEDTQLFNRIVALQNDWQPAGRMRLLKRALYGAAIDLMMWSPAFTLVTFPLLKWGHRSNSNLVQKFTRADAQPSILDGYPKVLESKMRPEQARTVLDQLPDVETNRQVRMANARRYYDALSGIDGIRLPEPIFDESSAWLEFPIIVEDRAGLYEFLLDQGRDLRLYYYRNCAQLDIYDMAQNRDCPNAQGVMDNTLMLPLYPSYGGAQAERNIEALRAYFAPGGPGHKADASEVAADQAGA